MNTERTPGSSPPPSPASGWERWALLLLGTSGLLVVGWAAVTAWGAVVHGHPAYAVVLALTLLGSTVALWRSRRRTGPRTRRRRLLRFILLVAAAAWIMLAAWLRPFPAVEPALSAMGSDDRVTVVESPTRIVLTPTTASGRTGLLFQPGARVDPRAYAAVLRPVAESGTTVVIAKPPLGIAFGSVDALDAARAVAPQPARWIVGGHSLGGTVAALQADQDADPTSPVVGLLLYASYPAGDLSTLDAAVLSVSASNDGLATPEKIAASREKLPSSTVFTSIDGAVHAFFGDYGPQPGDGTPTIDHDHARAQISTATVAFIRGLG